MVFTVRSAFPATSELGTPTPNVFSMLTTSSSASMESKPRPFAPKSGRSSPICSVVTCSIRFLTSISLMRVRRSDSTINEPRFCRRSRVWSNAHWEEATERMCSAVQELDDATRASDFRELDLVGFIARRNCLVRLWRCHAGCRLALASRHSRLHRFHVRLGGFSLGLSGFVKLVVEFVLCFLKLLHRLAHSAGKVR